MNKTPHALRPHIIILGKVNVGKSTLINALTNQTIALVSKEPGTTTDPVQKGMELLPYGPVVMIDTAGLDDPSVLGQARGEVTERALRRADLAILLITNSALDPIEAKMHSELRNRDIPTVIVQNVKNGDGVPNAPYLQVDALKGTHIDRLKDQLAERLDTDSLEPPLVADLLMDQRPVILVTPIDSGAPKGRLILPQVQTLRDIIDAGKTAVICRETELEQTLKSLVHAPQLVITDSQVFEQVAQTLPETIPLTSFSILMARYKGEIETLRRGAAAVEHLQPGDHVLIAEACTHHRQKDDIGTVKIPRWLEARVGGPLNFSWTSGRHFPDDVGNYDLIVHCGACMTNRRDMLSRIEEAERGGVSIVNYGVLIAHLNGILERSLSPLSMEAPVGN